MSLTAIIPRGKDFALQVCTAFINATGERGRTIMYGDFLSDHPKSWPADAALVFYGVTAETLPHYERAVREKRDFYYIDNGYFGAGHGPAGYMRITKNAMQHLGAKGNIMPARWNRIGKTARPMKQPGEPGHILVVCQSDFWYVRHGTTRNAWVNGVVDTLARSGTTREIRIRGNDKKGKPEFPISRELEGAYAAVAHSSNVLVEGILLGVHAFATASCAAWHVGNSNLLRIDDPIRYSQGDILHWAVILANNQWTNREIEGGVAWRMLSGADG